MISVISMEVKALEEKIPGSFSQTGEIDRLINYELIAYSPVNRTINPNDQVFLAPLVVDSDRNPDVEIDHCRSIVVINNIRIIRTLILRLAQWISKCLLILWITDPHILVNSLFFRIVNLEFNTEGILLKRLELS